MDRPSWKQKIFRLMNPLDWGRPFYDLVGPRLPLVSLILFTAMCAAVGGLAGFSYWSALGRQRDKELSAAAAAAKEDAPRDAQPPQQGSLPKSHESRTARSTPDVVPDRHISRSQMEQMRRALLPFPASKVAIYTMKDRPERSVYAAELGEAFRQAGWKPMRDPQRDLESFRFDQEGVLLIRHSQENTPDLKPLLAAFVAAHIQHTVVDLGGNLSGIGFYAGEVDTSTLVIFIGPRFVNPTVHY